MNKIGKIIIGIMSLIMILCIVFSSIKTDEASKQAENALKYYKENQALKAEAERQAELALRRTAEALEAQYEARTALEQLGECEKSK